MGSFDRFALVRSCRRGATWEGCPRLGPLARLLPGSAAILAACGLEARTPARVAKIAFQSAVPINDK